MVNREQIVLTMPLLTGTDGVRKMSKSYENYIGVTDAPGDIYGKTLRIPDTALDSWYDLLLGRPPDPDETPRDAKRALARVPVERFHGPDESTAAEAAFDRLFVSRELPEEIQAFRSKSVTAAFIAAADLRPVRWVEVRGARKLAQGGVKAGWSGHRPDNLDIPAASSTDGSTTREAPLRRLNLDKCRSTQPD